MIALKIDGGIAVATLCRPPVNAINEEWVARLEEVLDEVSGAEGVGVLWLRSSERVFCAGADLALMRSLFESAAGRERMIRLTRRMQAAFARLETLPKVTLAELGGAAMGGGFELALACDWRIVAETARIGLPEARLGLLPAAGGTQRMTRICGEAVARRLILSAELVDGVQAVALGLAQWSAPAEEIEARARALARGAAELPPATLAACKRCIAVAAGGGADGFEAELAASAGLLAESETQRRVARFLERSERSR
jgi:enoyl-CoA hydratase/carnithine racemase